MDSPVSIKELAREIRHVYDSDPVAAEKSIENALMEKLGHLPDDARYGKLRELMDEFGGKEYETKPGESFNRDIMPKFFSLMLGEDVLTKNISHRELLPRLADSLNIIFDSLNELVGVIDMNLYGGGQAGRETIRHMIGSHIQSEKKTMSLEKYIEKIKKSFLDSQKAFQNSIDVKIKEMLDEIDPEKLGGGKKKGFGPFQKAEMFKAYEQKFQTLKKWYESGRFKDDFLREFEKNCIKLSGKKEV